MVSRVDALEAPGLLIEALAERLTPLGVPFVAIDESQDGHGVEDVMAALLEAPFGETPGSLS